MEEIRKAHNTFKKELIQLVTREGDLILDVGCGCGVIFKMETCRSDINMCDPDEHLSRSSDQSKEFKNSCKLYHGDILIVQIENLI